MNVCAVCDKDMKFVYVLTGWEGSANDGRVLRDALNHSFSVPRGMFLSMLILVYIHDNISNLLTCKF